MLLQFCDHPVDKFHWNKNSRVSVVNALTLWFMLGMDDDIEDDELLCSFKKFLINDCGHGYLDQFGHAKTRGKVCVNPYHYHIDIALAQTAGFSFPAEVNELTNLEYVGRFKLLPDKKTFELRYGGDLSSGLASWRYSDDSASSTLSIQSPAASVDCKDKISTDLLTIDMSDLFGLHMQQQVAMADSESTVHARCRRNDQTISTAHLTLRSRSDEDCSPLLQDSPELFLDDADLAELMSLWR
jgi:hypothetical protein